MVDVLPKKPLKSNALHSLRKPAFRSAFCSPQLLFFACFSTSITQRVASAILAMDCWRFCTYFFQKEAETDKYCQLRGVSSFYQDFGIRKIL